MIWRSDSAKSTFRNDGTLMMDIYIYIYHTHTRIYYLYLFLFIFIYLFIYSIYIYIHIGMLINDKHQGYNGDISWDIMI